MSRTDDLRQSGGSERGGSAGGGAPFIKWGDDYTWLEGEVTGTFTTQYGLAVTLKVQAVSENGLDTKGRDEDGNNYMGHVTSGQEVNLGTNSAALDGKITAEDVGKVFHVAMEGWSESKTGSNRYRCFSVIELTERSAEGLEPIGAAVGGPSDDQPDSLIDQQASGALHSAADRDHYAPKDDDSGF